MKHPGVYVDVDEEYGYITLNAVPQQTPVLPRPGELYALKINESIPMYESVTHIDRAVIRSPMWVIVLPKDLILTISVAKNYQTLALHMRSGHLIEMNPLYWFSNHVERINP